MQTKYTIKNKGKKQRLLFLVVISWTVRKGVHISHMVNFPKYSLASDWLHGAIVVRLHTIPSLYYLFHTYSFHLRDANLECRGLKTWPSSIHQISLSLSDISMWDKSNTRTRVLIFHCRNSKGDNPVEKLIQASNASTIEKHGSIRREENLGEWN